MKPNIYKHDGRWFARAFDKHGTQHVGFDPENNTPKHAYLNLIAGIEASNDTPYVRLFDQPKE